MRIDTTGLYRQIGQGERGQFHLFIEFCADPFPSADIPLELQASWGRFQIWAGGRNLCAHYEDGVLCEHVTWYLLPLFEWFVKHWDFLFHEQKFPYRNVGGFASAGMRQLNVPETFEKRGEWDAKGAGIVDDWARRHSLLMNREGGLYPDVWLRRSGTKVEVSWTDDSVAGSPDAFQFCNGTNGVVLAPLSVATPLWAVLEAAVQTLAGAVPDGQRIKTLSKELLELRRPERRRSRVSLLAGLGDSVSVCRRRWTNLVNKLESSFPRKNRLIEDVFLPQSTNDLVVQGECAAALMFASVSPTISPGDAYKLAELMLETLSGDGARNQISLTRYAGDAPLMPNIAPWLQGYSLARQWCETAGGNYVKGEGYVDIEGQLASHGVILRELELDDASIGAVALARDGGVPVVAVNSKHPRNQFPTGRRFTLAHELCHLLHDCEKGIGLQVVSGAWAPVEVEQRANAFAAYVLMPDSLLVEAESEVGCAWEAMDSDQMLISAKRLHVSIDALVHHLHNRDLLSYERQIELVSELQNR